MLTNYAILGAGADGGDDAAFLLIRLWLWIKCVVRTIGWERTLLCCLRIRIFMWLVAGYDSRGWHVCWGQRRWQSGNWADTYCCVLSNWMLVTFHKKLLTKNRIPRMTPCKLQFRNLAPLTLSIPVVLHHWLKSCQLMNTFIVLNLPERVLVVSVAEILSVLF